MNPHSLILIRPAPDTVAWSVICPRLILHRALVGCSAMPYYPAPRAVLDTYVALSLVVRPSSNAVVADPAMAVRAHVPWRLRSSPVEPRAPTSVGGAGGAHALRHASTPTPMARNDQSGLPLPMLHMYVSSVSCISDVCRNCFILMFQK